MAVATIEEIRERRTKIDGAPWRYEKIGQTVWGFSHGGSDKSQSDYMVANIRGWGHLQYMGDERGDAKAQAMQDANGEFIARAPNDIDILLVEIGRLRGIISASQDPDGPSHRWRGPCGHEWRKDQSHDCPICKVAELQPKE